MSRFLTSSSSLFALLLLAAVPACTASDASDSEDSESDLHVKPKDGETLSRLTVTTPGGWTLPVNANDDGYATYRNAQVPFNNAQRLKEGDGTVTFAGKFDTTINAGNVTLVKGKASTFDLGSLKPAYVPTSDAASTLKREFGPTPQLKVFYTAAGQAEQQVYGQSNSQAAFWGGTTQKALLAPPGDYRFSWSLPILDDAKKTLGEGENANVNLAPADERATIVIKKPAARDLPDAQFPNAQCHLPTRTFLVHRTADNANGAWGEPASYDQRTTSQPNQPVLDGNQYYTENARSWAALPMKDDTTVRVFPFAASEGANHYELVVNNTALPLALKPGDTKTIQLERLDVDDVEITKETGDTYMAKGTWQLYRQGPNNSWIQIAYRQDCSNGGAQPASFATGTGVDVLPGTYRLVISYTTGEGPKQQEQVVSVP